MRVHTSIEKASDWCVRSGFSRLMYIDSLSLTWYLCEAETKMLKQSKLQEVGQHSQKTASACKRETICSMTGARARAWKSVGLLRQCNKRYSLHRKICRRCAYEACLLKIELTNLMTMGLQNRLMSLRTLRCATPEKYPMYMILK